MIFEATGAGWHGRRRRRLTALYRELTAPGEEGYDALRNPWLMLVDQHRALVVDAESDADVAATIQLARELGVMATGQGIAAGCDGGILLRPGRIEMV